MTTPGSEAIFVVVVALVDPADIDLHGERPAIGGDIDMKAVLAAQPAPAGGVFIETFLDADQEPADIAAALRAAAETFEAPGG